MPRRNDREVLHFVECSAFFLVLQKTNGTFSSFLLFFFHDLAIPKPSAPASTQANLYPEPPARSHPEVPDFATEFTVPPPLPRSFPDDFTLHHYAPNFPQRPQHPHQQPQPHQQQQPQQQQQQQQQPQRHFFYPPQQQPQHPGFSLDWLLFHLWAFVDQSGLRQQNIEDAYLRAWAIFQTAFGFFLAVAVPKIRQYLFGHGGIGLGRLLKLVFMFYLFAFLVLPGLLFVAETLLSLVGVFSWVLWRWVWIKLGFYVLRSVTQRFGRHHYRY